MLSLPSELIRPFAWLATVAFLVGFVGELLLGPRPAVAMDRPTHEAASGPASADWNLPRHI